jgi:hypothetical protein
MSLKLLLLAVMLIPATPGQTQTQAGGSTPAPPPSGAFLKLTIDPSRSPITIDTPAGISAEIRNVSKVPVRIFENETVFVTTPEIQIYDPQATGDAHDSAASLASARGCAMFPTQANRPAKRPDRGYDLLIQPEESYRVFWDLQKNGCADNSDRQVLRFWQPGWFKQKWDRAMFAPGTYKVYMDVVFHPEGQPSQTPDQSYHTTTDGRDVVISASESMVLLGAFLGGLLAYIVKLYYGVQTQLTVQMENARLKNIIGKTEWIVAGVFATTMVILASRLSDTFPVKVNANDFWGSITLGFVFQWFGVKLLEKLPGLGPATSPAAGPAAGPEPATPVPAAPAGLPDIAVPAPAQAASAAGASGVATSPTLG